MLPQTNQKMDAVVRMAHLKDGAGGSSSLLSRPAGIREKAKRAKGINIPGITNNTRSLLIFSEDHFLRKYAKAVIEWR